MYRRPDRQVHQESQSTYMDLLLSGEVLALDIDDFVDRWHDAPEGSEIAAQSLGDFLGMTCDEYQLWVERPESLRFIAAAHKRHQPVGVVLKEKAGLMLAARGSSESEARELLNWLIERGRVRDNTRCR